MKLILITVSIFVSQLSYASPNCTYVLNQEEYWENASGVLTVDTQVYGCKTIYLGQNGDMRTVCVSPEKLGSSPEVYDFIIYFDGAEANFDVSTDLDMTNILCSGVATTK